MANLHFVRAEPDVSVVEPAPGGVFTVYEDATALLATFGTRAFTGAGSCVHVTEIIDEEHVL